MGDSPLVSLGQEFSLIFPKFPNRKLAEALFISLSLPGIFRPRSLRKFAKVRVYSSTVTDPEAEGGD